MSTPASSSASASNSGDGGSLVHAEYASTSNPAHRTKQVVLSLAAIVLAVATFVPWWKAEIPLNRVAESLNAWQLVWTGLGIGNLAIATGYSPIGNILFGLVPVLPVILLVILCILRVSGFAVLPANTLFLWSLLAALGAGWMFLFGLLRLDVANGVFPVMLGPWIVLIVSIALCALLLVWWSAERVHFPKRKLFGLGAAAPEVREEIDPDALFADIESNDRVEDSPIEVDESTGIIDLSDIIARNGDGGRAPGSTPRQADRPGDDPEQQRP